VPQTEENCERNSDTLTDNRLLGALSGSERALLKPHCETSRSGLGKFCEAPHKMISHVYFMTSGLASVVARRDPSSASRSA